MEKLKNVLHPRRNSQKFSTSSFRHWAVAFIVCDFNVDVGPEVLLVYPPDTPFSQSDLSAICFNSFPERQDGETVHDLTFQFTTRNRSADVLLASPCAPHGSPSHFHGSCLFRQTFDGTTKRSFDQKSLVLISNHDFPALFHRVLHLMTDAGNICDPITLEAACTQIAAWPPPSIGRHDLPFLGSLLALEIAPHAAFPLQGLSMAPAPLALAGSDPSPIYAYQPTGSWAGLVPYLSSLSELYITFEKMLLCENVVVIAKSPQLVSEVVSALVDLIKPVPYAGEIRPYLTMQSEFSAAGLNGGTSRHFIVGITNPFLLKRMVDAVESSGGTRPHVVYLHNSGQVPLKQHRSQHSSPIGFDIPGGAIDSRFPMKYHLKADRTFLQSLDGMMRVASTTGPDTVGPLIRRHFAELTAQYLSPIIRYLATGMSPNVASPGGNLQYANFNEVEFLQSLSKHGTSVKFRGQGPLQRHKARNNLYAEFCRSPNFYSWLDMKLSLEKEASAGLLNGSASSGS
ncbi:DUF1630-domain-containing protein [Saccharata proteae CBS 121410]|uniref:DUF1630-domain-containing protein n=1 Tax=Saccharata proteae CBS 121410 TaxID=1314787 RepID=A0A9P4LTS6_9PEZI|nr:DUF1630-domain-containing protein [Saccharata proteae CBS 121410]